MAGEMARGGTLTLDLASLTPEGTAWLVVESGPGAGATQIIGNDPLLVGSDAAAGLRIDDPHVSRRHAEIRRGERGFVLRDLGSTNGTFIAGLTIKEATLASGVEIKIGTSTLRFELGGQEGQLARLARRPLGDEELAHAPSRFGDAIGAGPSMRRVFALLARLGPTDLTITLIGETGSGKDVLARAVHQQGLRAGGPFVVFDCGAVAPSLIESELFGHEKGAFTGAVAQRLGAFERAHGGTLFLDEIGELSLELQPKLLRVLEQRTVRRVGGTEDLAVDLRIVAATNRDLEAEVKRGAFREDLFFRLLAAMIHVPPLRERREDLPELARRFLEEDGRADGRARTLAPETLELLRGYEWPGNVRELRNVIAGAAAMADGPELRPEHLVFFRPQKRRTRKSRANPIAPAGQTLVELEKAAISDALARADGNRTRAAKALGIAPSTLYEKLKRYGIKPE